MTEESSLKLKYALGLGIASGIGAVIKISDALGIKFELSPVYASARVREAEIENDNVKYTVKFEKNEKDLPEDTQKTIYEHGGPKHSFSSLSVKAGVVLGF